MEGAEYLEMANKAQQLNSLANDDEKSELMQITTSNRTLVEKNVVITLSGPFQTHAERAQSTDSDPDRARHRTFES